MQMQDSRAGFGRFNRLSLDIRRRNGQVFRHRGHVRGTRDGAGDDDFTALTTHWMFPLLLDEIRDATGAPAHLL